VNASVKVYECGDTACNFIFFQNIAAAVGVIIVYNKKIVMTVRAEDPAKKLLDLPGGFVDQDENLEAAAKREVKEELNIDLQNLTYLCSAPNRYRYKNIEYLTLDSIFVSNHESLAGIKIDGQEIEAYKLVSLEDFDPAAVAFPSITAGIQLYRDSCRQTIETF